MPDSVHQRLMNEAYDLWRDHSDWSTETFLMSLEPLQRDAAVLGQLNHQVQNGGLLPVARQPLRRRVSVPEVRPESDEHGPVRESSAARPTGDEIRPGRGVW